MAIEDEELTVESVGHKPEKEIRLCKMIDGKVVTTEDLDAEHAGYFIQTAQHMIDHLRKQFNLPK